MPDYTACEGVTEATTLRVDALETENAILRQREAEARNWCERLEDAAAGVAAAWALDEQLPDTPPHDLLAQRVRELVAVLEPDTFAFAATEKEGEDG